jgi:outer membrane protein OmpA-like peptidoglycan-associated protein
MKSILYTYCLLLLMALTGASQASAQSPGSEKKYFRQAEREYAARQYLYAIPLYKAAIKAGGNELVILSRLADCYWQIRNADSALCYYTYSEQKDKEGMDPQAKLRYAELLAQNSEYNRAIDILGQLEKNGSDNNTRRVQARKEGFMHPGKFKEDSLRCHIQYLNINSSQSDYSPRFYGQGMVYISNRITGDRSTREIASNGNTYSRLYQVKDASLLAGKDTMGRWSQPSYREQTKINDDDTRQTSNDNSIVPIIPVLMSNGNMFTGSPAEPFAKSLHVDFNNGPVCFNKEQDIIYFTRNRRNKEGDVYNLEICSAVLKNGGWGQVTTLPFVKEGYDYFHPALSADGSRLYFCSNQPGGAGGADIYSFAITGDSSLKITNESSINTEGNELFPTVHGDTLYFSSDGYAGLGGLDIYRVLRKNGLNTQPENLGYPVNSSYDDFGMVYANGTEGLFTSNRLGSDDIYSFSIDPGYISRPVKDSLEHIASIKREAEEALAGKSADNFARTRKEELDRFKQQLNDYANQPKAPADILSKTILFETAEDKLLLQSMRVLEEVKIYMDKHPDYMLMIDGHTDIRADEGYNLDLSIKRATTVRRYLIAKGIAEERLISKGYGITSPIAPNGTSYGRKLNRRVELKSIKK